jgi:biotin carboxyl carrier protein
MAHLGESLCPMSEATLNSQVADRVRALAELFVETDLLRLRVERKDETIELGRALRASAAEAAASEERPAEAVPVRGDAIKADLVGIFHLSRPTIGEGDLLESDRELAYIEALGIRNPVRSLGPGRIVSVGKADGDPVEYGAVLFEIDRG